MKKEKRNSKNEPLKQAIPKRPVSVLREVIPGARKKSLDPRFDRAFGHYNEDLFGKSYEFVGELQQKEREVLRESMKREKHEGKRQQMQRWLDRQRSMEINAKKQFERKQVIKEWKNKERQLVAQGKKPFHLKDKEVDRMVVEKRFAEIKARGGDPEKILEKKAKKRAAKQHKRLPLRKVTE